MTRLIRSYIERLDLTQTEVAEALGCTQGAVSRYMNGEIPFPVHAVIVLTRVGQDMWLIERVAELCGGRFCLTDDTVPDNLRGLDDYRLSVRAARAGAEVLAAADEALNDGAIDVVEHHGLVKLMEGLVSMAQSCLVALRSGEPVSEFASKARRRAGAR